MQRTSRRCQATSMTPISQHCFLSHCDNSCNSNNSLRLFIPVSNKYLAIMDVEHFSSPTSQFPKKKCGVLGATGSVGQRFILLLALHPHFTLHAVGASERSAGKKYRDAVRWKQSWPMSKELGELVVRKCTPEEFKDCDIVFSGLDSDVAGDVGEWPRGT